MGFEIKNFQGDVDEEFICPICSGVLEDPLQAPACEHAFCRACITEWTSRQSTCPVDRQAVTLSQLTPVPRILRNFLSRLCTKCDYSPHGCNAVLKLDSLASHLVECEFNPKKPMPCEAGCGLVIPKDELAKHNCVRELRALLVTHQGKLNDYKQELAEQRLIISKHKGELVFLKFCNIYGKQIFDSTSRSMAEHNAREVVMRWAKTLPRASVTRWGSMISKPDDVLQIIIKRSLSVTGCPTHMIDDLMENCHERRWPLGLSSLETTQNNTRLYEKYVCKRVPGAQAVVVLPCDNTHVDEHMMVEPGLVIIFANGIE